MKSLDTYSAYHGGTWKFREFSHKKECEENFAWPFQGVNSEFGALKEVLLLEPGKKAPKISNVEKVQHLRPLDWNALAKELKQLTAVFEKNGVVVRKICADWFEPVQPNLMFIRDHFFLTPWGAILGRMASPVRAGEEKWAQLALAAAGIPVLAMIQGEGTFEGADALWVSPTQVFLGLGNRTNQEGYQQIKKILSAYGVQVRAFNIAKSTQHLLGAVQIVAPKRVLLREQKVNKSLVKAFPDFEIILVPETGEVTHGQALNLVTISPNRVIIPADCNEMKAFLARHKIQVLAEVPVAQLLNAAGGIACATGILSRALRK